MQIVNLMQGSPEWHAHRANHFNASDAPAMMGVSKYTTRDELLHKMATGLTKEVDAATQKRYDDGHKFEALARPLAEKFIGDDLSPTVGSEGKLSASFDGITFDDSIIFEHKTLNDELRDVFHNKDSDTVELPLMYRVQMEQQLLISGAEQCLFMASTWKKVNYETEFFVLVNSDGRMALNGKPEYYSFVEEHHCWYRPDIELRQKIMAGWEQFAKDLSAYVPPVVVEKFVAETVEALPVPSVVVRGEITQSNIAEITPKFDAYLESIKTELSTDQDFADADENAKNCELTEKRIQALRENIIAQMVTVNEVDSALAKYQKAFKDMKVFLKNAVTEQKTRIKTNAILQAKNDYATFVGGLQGDLPITLHQHLTVPDFADAIKGVSKMDSMRSRINDALAKGKTEAAVFANDVKAKVALIAELSKGYEHLIQVSNIATADIDYIKLYIANVKDAEDKRKADYEAQVKAQAEANARAKLEAEKRATEAAGTNHEPASDKSDSNPLPGNVEQQFKEHVAQPIRATATRTTPSANQIVEVVANHYAVDKATAHKWLLEIDFAGMMKAAA